jgi:hypothetical protein
MTFDEAKCLAQEPWVDRDCDVRVFSDRFVVAAKDHEKGCIICAGDIHAKTRHRARTETYEGVVVTFRICPTCCAALAIANEDSGKAWEQRVSLVGPAQ